MRPKRLLLTGAAGEIGRVLRPALRGAAEAVRWHDLRPIKDAAPGEEVMTGDLTVPGAAELATEGVDCLVHLAAIPRETDGTPEEILAANVIGTHRLFEAARQAGVRRFIFPSSNHVIGFYRADRPVGTVEPPRPDGHYGVSKVFGEAIGRLYADKHGRSPRCASAPFARGQEMPGSSAPGSVIATWRSSRGAAWRRRLSITSFSTGSRRTNGRCGSATPPPGLISATRRRDRGALPRRWRQRAGIYRRPEAHRLARRFRRRVGPSEDGARPVDCL
jgi:hypothetical protein